VTNAAPAKAERFRLWGPMSGFGLFVAAAACLVDQAVKCWLWYVFGLTRHVAEPVAPFVNLTLTWNTGISYGLFPQQGTLGAWALLTFKVFAVIFLWLWLARSASRMTALALSLIIGGAIGNAIDRLHWPGVMDFVDLHAGNFHWYVFNLADVAIVSGVVALLYESLRQGGAAKAPRSGI
jgi:signal peptidase II